MKGLTGAQAVERLERRGGQVAVFRRGHGTTRVFDVVGRDQGRAIVAAHSPDTAPGAGEVLATESDRAALAREMERALENANGRRQDERSKYILVHHDILSSDAGYAQIGCFLALFSVIAGLIVGLLIAWIVLGEVKGDAALVGPVVGFVVGFFGIEGVARIAVYIPPIRDRLETIAYAWTAVVPAALTAATIIVWTMSSRAAGSMPF